MALIRQSCRQARLTNESLNQYTTAQDQMNYLRDFYFMDPTMPETHIGGKQSVRAMVDLKAVAKWLVEEDIKVVRLRRDNIVKAAISQMRAELYAKQTERETSKAMWGVRPTDTPLGSTQIELAGFKRRLKAISDANIALLGAFESTKVLDLEYEQINMDLPGAMAMVREFLSLPEVKFVVPFIKATPDDVASVVVNIEEVRASLAETKFAAMI